MTPAQIAELAASVIVKADEIAKRRRQRIIRIAITAEAFEAIASTLPLGNVAYETERYAKGGGGQVRIPIYNPTVVVLLNTVKGEDPRPRGNASAACYSSRWRPRLGRHRLSAHHIPIPAAFFGLASPDRAHPTQRLAAG